MKQPVLKFWAIIAISLVAWLCEFNVKASLTPAVMAPGVPYQIYGLNFSPYIDDDEDPNKGGDQITDGELLERMEIIAPYTEWIRIFGCNEDLKEAGP